MLSLSLLYYNNLGNVLKDLGKPKEAEEAYNKAISIKPDYAEAYFNKGNVLKDQSRLEEAIEAYKDALSASLIILKFITTWAMCSGPR